MPSDTRVCPFCAEPIEAMATTCGSCHADLTAPEVLGREPQGSRRGLMVAGGVLVAVLVAYGATLLASGPRPHHASGEFNVFTKVKDACEKDDGNVVTTDQHGTPTAFATPDGPERYWCVSQHYLTSIGYQPADPLPPVRRIPSEDKWLWPRTSYGH
jgi:hypothetical protein